MKTPFRRTVTRASVAAASAIALALGLAVPATAAQDAVDQQQLSAVSFQRQIPVLAQTFTAGVSGGLDKVSLGSDATSGLVSLHIAIMTTTSSGAPSGSELASASWSGSLQCCRQLHNFNFSPAVSLAAGTKYALVVQTVSGVFTWWNSSTLDNYSRGQLFVATCTTCTYSAGAAFGQDFTFQTWMTTATNQNPVVAADNASVTVNEGSAPTNTGTFSDPDGDSVTLTASSGSVVRTGLTSGTWSWTGAAADEGTGPNVTVSASDGHGGTATTSFTVAVTPVAPTAHATGPASGPEGSAVTVSGSATSPDASDNKAGFTYAWQVTKNGASYGSGSGPSLTFTPDDDGTYVATLHATDDGAMSGTDSWTVVGTNVAPSAHITGVTASAPLVILPWETLTFAGSFTDPGVLDTHTARWTFGDGTTSSAASFAAGGSASFSTTHAYTAAGYYSVTLTVTDKDGGVGHATTGVQVESVAQALTGVTTYVNGLPGLNAGQKNSLTAHLRAASAAAARGSNRAAANELNAFLNELQAYVSSGKVSPANAATLRLAIHAVQSALGTFNRFLEWWPLEA